MFVAFRPLNGLSYLDVQGAEPRSTPTIY